MIGMLVFMNHKKVFYSIVVKSCEMMKYLENVMCHECNILTMKIFLKADLIMNVLHLLILLQYIPNMVSCLR